MVPTRSLLHHDDFSSSPCCITTQLLEARRDQRPPKFPRLVMADDGDAPRGRSGEIRREADEAGTSSRGAGVLGEGHHRDWLQLGLATASDDDRTATPTTTMGIDFFSGKPRPPAPLFPLPIRSAVASRPEMLSSSCHGRYVLPLSVLPLRSSGVPTRRPVVAGMIRVVSPPRRPETAGVWLLLQAAPNQFREPILPQIPKSYLRIKDSNMKVEVLLKYLADKLGLGVSQVELTCRGQLLPALLGVQYVRDNIWCRSTSGAAPLLFHDQLPRPVNSAAAATDYVMTLLYSTRTTNT